jgi:hypothetical protein
MRVTPAARNVSYTPRVHKPRSLLKVGAALSLACAPLACAASQQEGTHVFVRDPHQVWVEAAAANGVEVVLPPGQGLSGVRVREGDYVTKSVISYTTLFREPSGGITIDDRTCAPWPTSPLSASGELSVMKTVGEAPFVSDGPTVRIPYLCTGPHDEKIELDFVTPWTNVREVHVIQGETRPIAASSTHPALQREDWRQ